MARKSNKLCFDPELRPGKPPPGIGDPTFSVAYAKANMFMTAGLAGASKRVLHSLFNELDPLAVAIVEWIRDEVNGAVKATVEREMAKVSASGPLH